jgi:hypothetical protein
MASDRIDLSGQVALVTGGGRGIGRDMPPARAGEIVAYLASGKRMPFRVASSPWNGTSKASPARPTSWQAATP